VEVNDEEKIQTGDIVSGREDQRKREILGFHWGREVMQHFEKSLEGGGKGYHWTLSGIFLSKSRRRSSYKKSRNVVGKQNRA